MAANDAQGFVEDWIAKNVRHDPNCDGDVDARIARLREQMRKAAFKAGFTDKDWALSDGALNDLLTLMVEIEDGHPHSG